MGPVWKLLVFHLILSRKFNFGRSFHLPFQFFFCFFFVFFFFFLEPDIPLSYFLYINPISYILQLVLNMLYIQAHREIINWHPFWYINTLLRIIWYPLIRSRKTWGQALLLFPNWVHLRTGDGKISHPLPLPLCLKKRKNSYINEDILTLASLANAMDQTGHRGATLTSSNAADDPGSDKKKSNRMFVVECEAAKRTTLRFQEYGPPSLGSTVIMGFWSIFTPMNALSVKKLVKKVNV